MTELPCSVSFIRFAPPQNCDLIIIWILLYIRLKANIPECPRDFRLKFVSGKSTLEFGKNKEAEHLRRYSERQLETLKVSILVKAKMVNSNRFSDELSTENSNFETTRKTFTCSKTKVETLEKVMKYAQSWQ